MTRADLIEAITAAIQREHGYSQSGVGETVVAELERLLQTHYPHTENT